MYQWLLSQLTTQCLTFKYTQDICRSIEKINHIWTHGYRISKEQTRFFKLTLRIEGSGRGHWIGRSLSRGSIGCSTGLNSTAAWIPWAPAAAAVVAVPGTAPVTAGFGGNTSLSSYILHKLKIDLTLNLIEKKNNNKKTERDRVCVLTMALWVRRWPALPTENLEKIPTMLSPLSLILNNFKNSFDSLTTVFVSVSKKSSSYYFDRPINVCHIQDDKGRDRGSCNLKRWLLLLGVLGFACIQILSIF